MKIPNEKTDLIDEIQATKLQIHRKPLNETFSAQEPNEGVILVKASEMNPRPIDWLWDGWIAKGKLHLIGGVAGTGKTTLSLDLASQITNGGEFPDGQRAKIGDVVMWTGEDDPEDTLTPRLMAMNANLEKLHFIRGLNDGRNIVPFNPATDMTELETRLESIRDLKLLIIDPIVAVTTGDSNNNAETRKDLTPLTQLAEKLKIAVIGITHFTKNTSGKEPIERFTGSLAFGAVARVAMVATKTKDEEGKDTRIFLRVKSNIGRDDGGIYYSLEETKTSTGIETSKIAWGGMVAGSGRELLAQAEEESTGEGLKDCIEWLTETLSSREMKSKDAVKEAKDAGFTEATLRRARKKLGVISTKKGLIGEDGYWVIELPNALKTSLRRSHSDVSILEKNEHLKGNSSVMEIEL